MSVESQKHIVFLDGIGCNPEGYKPRFIAGLGYRVTAPLLPDLDFEGSTAIADEIVARSPPDVIVGYSRGAGVAMALRDRLIPRLLVAPSLRWVSRPLPFEGRIVILHSATDEGIELKDVRDHLSRCAWSAALRVVGEDHAMIDPAALDAMTAALDELSSAGPG